MSRIRVMHLMNGFGDASIGRIVQRLVLRLGSDRFEWHVTGVCGLGDLKDEFARMGVRVVDFSAPEAGSGSLNERIRAYITANKIDIVHTHTIRTILTAARALPRVQRPAHIATKHILTDPRERRYGLVVALADYASLYLPDHLVAVSNGMQKQIRRLPGLAHRVTAVPNAIDCARYVCPDLRQACRDEFGAGAGDIVLITTGRLSLSKRIEPLVRTFARVRVDVPNLRLWIVGEGEERAAVEAAVGALGLREAVCLAGFRKDIPRLLSGADIYVQASVNEGLSLSLLEAMAARKVVVATRVGGTGEVLTHGQNGLLIAPESDRELDAALLELARSPALRETLADAGQKMARERYDLPRMMESYRQLYEAYAVRAEQSSFGPPFTVRK